MKRAVMLILSVFVISVAVLGTAMAAVADFQTVNVKNPVTGDVKNTISVPSRAVEVSHGLYYLGTARYDGKTVEGYAIIGYAKPGGKCGNGVCDAGENAKNCPTDCGGGTTTSTCYAFLAKGAKWKTTEDYVINPMNKAGLNISKIPGNVAGDITKWETAAGTTGIIGSGTTTTDALSADMTTPDGKNEVYFGNISDAGAIGITIVWGTFSGPVGSRELIEWDQVYDDTDFAWAMDGSANAMDFENIATHELGHTVGMGDLYTSACSDQTMYGYAGYGETKKQTLESGDIAGIKALYK